MQPCNKEYIQQSFKNFELNGMIERWKQDNKVHKKGVEMLIEWQKEYPKGSFKTAIIQEQIDISNYCIDSQTKLINKIEKELKNHE